MTDKPDWLHLPTAHPPAPLSPSPPSFGRRGRLCFGAALRNPYGPFRGAGLSSLPTHPAVAKAEASAFVAKV